LQGKASTSDNVVCPITTASMNLNEFPTAWVKTLSPPKSRR